MGTLNRAKSRLARQPEDIPERSRAFREGEDIVVSSQFLIDSESNLKAAVMKMKHYKMNDGALRHCSGYENKRPFVERSPNEQIICQ